jgi:hypothetical protein
MSNTHLIFRIKDDVICCPFDEVFFQHLLKINEKFPNTLKMVKGYTFPSKRAFCEWMDDLVQFVCDVKNENEVIVYEKPVDVEEWVDAYLGDLNWKDFDLVIEKGDERYKTMWDKDAPVHHFFQYSEDDNNIPLLHTLYAKKSIFPNEIADIPMEWFTNEENILNSPPI